MLAFYAVVGTYLWKHCQILELREAPCRRAQISIIRTVGPTIDDGENIGHPTPLAPVGPTRMH